MNAEFSQTKNNRVSSRRESSARPRLLYVAAAVFVLTGATWAISLWRADVRLNLSCVEEGALYRSGQPSARQLGAIVSKHDVRTLVNLRGTDALGKDKRAVDEVEFAKSHGLRYVNIPYSNSGAQAQIAEFLTVVADPANRPVLVHCAEGIERTGVMVAAYRMKVQGWPLAKALAEMKQFGFKQEKSPKMQEAVEEFANPHFSPAE